MNDMFLENFTKLILLLEHGPKNVIPFLSYEFITYLDLNSLQVGKRDLFQSVFITTKQLLDIPFDLLSCAKDARL